MNYRKYELLGAEDITTPTTKPIDLKGLDPISRINIQTLQTQVSSDFTGLHPASIIQKVQIVDGSTVLYDATGLCLQAQNFYYGPPAQINQWYDDLEAESRCNFRINFGRGLFDTELAFDPSKYKNPQLRITHDKTKAGSAAGSTAQTMRVEAELFDEKIPTLIGFLQFKEIFVKALVASGTEYIDLPTDLIIRNLMFQSLFASRRPPFQLDNWKLSEDNGKRVVFEDSIAEMLPNLPTFRYYTEQIQHVTAAGLRNIRCTPAYFARCYGVVKNSDDSIYCQPNDGGRVQLGCGNAGQEALITVEGYCPHGTISYPFGDPMDMLDWYNPMHIKKLQLKLVASQHATNLNDQTILLEQLVKY